MVGWPFQLSLAFWPLRCQHGMPSHHVPARLPKPPGALGLCFAALSTLPAGASSLHSQNSWLTFGTRALCCRRWGYQLLADRPAS